MTTRCNNCFHEYDSYLDLCPYCGYEDGDPAAEPYFLYPGMILNDRYIVGEVQGFGGFGIIYKAWDRNLNTVVAIKEYYYAGIAARQPGTQTVLIYTQNRGAEFRHFLKRFLDEARCTVKFSSNNNIVNVYDFFEANNTAYIVMEFLDGVPLNEYLKKSRIETEQCVYVMQCVCSALKTVHAAGIIHRDISPDNIMICSNGKVKLFDFGAARFCKNEDYQGMKLTQVMKPGFSPPEQYQTVSKQGPWTDIYALGATLYYMMTGIKPAESTNRKTTDDLKPPKELNPDVPDHINDTILRAMAVETHLRFSSADDFEKALRNEVRVLNVAKEKKRRRKNRAAGLIAAVLIVAAGFAAFAYYYDRERLAGTLPDCSLEFWYALPSAEEPAAAKQASFEAIIRLFGESYPNVTITARPYPPDEYANVISAAHDSGTLPSLFESAEVDASVLESALSVDIAVQAADLSKVLFFGAYPVSSPGAKQFPLGFTAPVRYTNTVLPDDGGPVINDKDLFLSGASREYTGSTSDYFDVQAALPARYTISPADSVSAACSFADFLSIGNCDSAQLPAVNRLLVFMLGEKAQDLLHIQYRSGSLPLNRKVLTDDCAVVYNEFAGLFDDIDKNFRIG